MDFNTEPSADFIHYFILDRITKPTAVCYQVLIIPPVQYGLKFKDRSQT